MVIDSEGPRTGHDRGQLLLISALAIAFILLGVVVVFNSVQYTQTVDSGSSGESMADVPMTEQQLEDGIEDLVRQYNATEMSEGDLEDDIDDFVEQYANARAHQRPVSVDLEIDEVDIDGDDDVEVIVDFEYRTADVATSGTITVEVPEEEML